MPISRRRFAGSLSAASLGTAFVRIADAQFIGLFQHGVASGDPLTDRVIIWTRVSLASPEDVTPVEWTVAEDSAFRTIVRRGVTSTGSEVDFTVKVDVTRLKPGKTYYYRFAVRGVSSQIGRTKTLPEGSLDRLRFAVVSCSNFPYGYFNVYRAVANRADLDCVLHLGDYIYEYANAEYGNGTALNRIPEPAKVITVLSDYRQRYAQYRRDADLQEVHRQHAFIIVWDDHESANDAWVNGAENHTPATEGSWADRRAASIQAWFEWLPVRENPYNGGQIYRSFRFGDLIDLVMLDTRLEGRSMQVAPTSPAIADPNRSLLSATQESWFYQNLSESQSRNVTWRVVGQQVMMGQLLSATGAPFNADQWDGYIASRNRFLQYLASASVTNVVILTGDIHSSWGNEITANPFNPQAYDGRTGRGSQAVEFVTPAVTSPGIDNRAQATALEDQIRASHAHVKYVDLFRRGYLLMDITKERAQGEWYHMQTITQRSVDQEFARALQTVAGSSRLTAAGNASSAKDSAPLAP